MSTLGGSDFAALTSGGRGEPRIWHRARTRICSNAMCRFAYTVIGVSLETYSVDGAPVT